jgi:hypothetical protein
MERGRFRSCMCPDDASHGDWLMLGPTEDDPRIV